MRILPWVLVVILAAIVGLGAFKFVIQGSTAEAGDGRTSVLVTAGERDRVMGEMRAALEAVQEIAAAVAEGDMDAAARAAEPVGMVATQNESPAFMGKLPIELKLQGRAMHQGFDDLAALARGGADQTQMLGALADHLTKCTGCHAGFRFDVQE